MELIVAMPRAFCEQTEIDPATISEGEISSAVAPGEWYLHVQPEQPWYAVMHSGADQGLVAQYDYLTEESTDQGAEEADERVATQPFCYVSLLTKQHSTRRAHEHHH